jgi:hypothetical protein
MSLLSVVMRAFLAIPMSRSAAQQRPILSPRDSVRLMLDTNFIDVNYGRPSMRGRVIMGQLVPWNKVWRTGANQATHFTTTLDLTLGTVPVPRGRYTLYTLPSPTGWKIILNKQTDQWGTVYNPSLDLARFDAGVEALPAAVDTFTIRLEKTGKSSGILKLLWEKTMVSATFARNDRMRPLSPFDSIGVALGGKGVRITYSRPSIRGRSIWGCVVPYDSIWRTGANNATTFDCDDTVQIGGLTVPRGSYTLYSMPASNGLTLIVSKKQGGSGPSYDSHMDLGRINLPAESSARVIDPFRIWFDRSGGTSRSVTLRIGWAHKVFSTPLRLK